jgi:hypothetical protein
MSQPTDEQRVGERLKILRITFGGAGRHTARPFCELLGIGVKRWYNLEHSGKISRDMMLLLYSEFGISPNWILLGVGPIRLVVPSSRSRRRRR